MKNRWLIAGFLLICSIVMTSVFSVMADTAIRRIIEEYSGILDCPSLADVDGDATKEIVYMNTAGQLYVKEPDGLDVFGWPYEFPEGQWGNKIAIYDMDSNGKEEIIVSGGFINNESEYFVKILKHSETGPEETWSQGFTIDRTGVPQSFWTNEIVVGNVDSDVRSIDSDMDAEIIAYQTVIKLDGRYKSIVEDLSNYPIFVIGTPMIVEDNNSHFVVFHAVEVPDLENRYSYTRAIYCIKVNWNSPNELIWRVQLGLVDDQYHIFPYTWCWGELGAGDLDNDGHIEVATTADLGRSFEFRVIDINGEVVNSMNLGLLNGYAYHLHKKFVIADIGCGKRVVFFDNNSELVGELYSQPACADVDGDGVTDFLIRGASYHGRNEENMVEVDYVIVKVSPQMSDYEGSIYEPIMVPVNSETVTGIYYTDRIAGWMYTNLLSHLVAADINDNGYLSVVGTKPDGLGIDIIEFDSPSFMSSDWKQAYGNSRRTNNYSLAGLYENSLPEIEHSHPSSPVEIHEGETQEFWVTASDPDGDLLRIGFYLDNELIGCKKADTSNPFSFKVQYVTDYYSEGEHVIRAEIYDGKDYLIHSWDVEVLHTNAPPGFVSEIGDKVVDENEFFAFAVSAIDPDGDELTYSADGLPAGASFDPNTHTFSWTPTYEQEGSYKITFTVTDPYGFKDSQTVTITVNNFNRTPEIDSYSPETDVVIKEGEKQEFRVAASDPDGDRITYAWKLDGIVVASGSNTYIYEPGYEDAGEHTITVVVSDGELEAEYTWEKIVVDNLNRAPIIDSYSGSSTPIGEGESREFSVTAHDPDRDEITYTWFVDSEVAASGSNTYIYEPGYEDAGRHTITIVISDGELEAEYTWEEIVVNNVNRAPIIDSYSVSERMDENESQEFSVDAHDPDGDVITYTWYVDGEVVASGGNTYTYTPGYEDAGSHTITVVISDGELEAERRWRVIVENRNRSPIFDSFSPEAREIYLDVGESQEFIISAHDPDGDTIYYTWKLDSEIVSTTNSYIYNPGPDDLGHHLIVAEITDGNSRTLIFHQWPVHVGHPPEFIPIEDQTVREGEVLEFLVEATDPDGDPLVYGTRRLPEGATFDPDTQLFRWQPDYDQAGNYYIIHFYVTDGVFTVYESVNIDVVNVNRRPIIDSYNPPEENIEMDEGAEKTFSIEASDPDGEDLYYEWYLDNEPIGINSNEYTYTPSYDDAGMHIIKVEVSDGKDIVGVKWIVTVNNKNRPPVIESYSPAGDIEMRIKEFQKFMVVASDPDGDKLIYKWYLDSELLETTDSNKYTYWLRQKNAKNHIIKVEVTDGSLSVEHEWKVNVIANFPRSKSRRFW